VRMSLSVAKKLDVPADTDRWHSSVNYIRGSAELTQNVHHFFKCSSDQKILKNDITRYRDVMPYGKIVVVLPRISESTGFPKTVNSNRLRVITFQETAIFIFKAVRNQIRKFKKCSLQTGPQQLRRNRPFLFHYLKSRYRENLYWTQNVHFKFLRHFVRKIFRSDNTFSQSHSRWGGKACRFT